MKNSVFISVLSLLIFGCGIKKTTDTNQPSGENAVGLNPAYLKSANPNLQITKVPCTLSDGTKTECFQILTNSTPVDHQMGPWCPDNISDDASAGGIWISDGNVYDLDGEFIRNLANFYNDSTWKMYDANGDVFITETEEDCKNAANPNVGQEYQNYCVECLPSYMTNVTQTYTIPVHPVQQKQPTFFMGAPGGERPTNQGNEHGPKRPKNGQKPEGPPNAKRPSRNGNSIPSTRGIALNGVEFSAPAPVNAILSAYTIAPFDDAGGHINVHQGYHYHAATGISFSIPQNDGHAHLIGYALDGFGIFANTDEYGKEPTDLDECRGHYDEIRGYHYHVDAAGNNNFINCLKGAFVK